jgi:hypothetical protein
VRKEEAMSSVGEGVRQEEAMNSIDEANEGGGGDERHRS